MHARFIRYAERSAPRYTSYPTAPHFTDAVDGAVVADWLGELTEQTTLSLYLHVPYCRDLCWYCGCHTFAARRAAPIETYVATLIREIEHVAGATKARRVREIHWGGGTPNILAPEEFAAVFNTLARVFDISDLREHAIELDPRGLTGAQCQAFRRAGVTRASLGIQDVNENVQRAIGRVQPWQVVEAAFDNLQAVGIDKINADLMYGLPKQTVADAQRSAEMVTTLKPARLAAFGYAHVPWFKTRQRLIDVGDLPPPSERIEQAETIRETLIGSGYVALGFDHYARSDDSLARAARDGALHRNFQGYVDDDADALVGLGVSAISTFPQGYAQNISDVSGWRAKIETGALATARGRALTDEDRTRGSLINELLCAFAVDLARFGGARRFAPELESLKDLQSDGVFVLEGERLFIPEEARPVARLVAQAFDAYREQGAARHSQAV